MKLGVLAPPDSWYYRDLQRAAGARVQLQSVLFSQLASGLAERPWVAAAGVAPLDQLDAVLVRTMPPGSLEQIVFRMDALHRLAAAGTLVLNPPRSLEIAVDKYLASALLHGAGLPTPRTVVCQTVNDALAAFHELGQDTVLKPLFGSEGRGITRVTDEAVAWRVFKSLVQVGAVIYQQQYIPHHGWDLRLLVIGEQMFAMRRRNPLDWRTNLSRGATGEPFAASSSQLDLARRAVQAVQASFIGVDILPGQDGRDYVLEVNAVPGWRGLSRCLQIDVARHVLDWLEQQLQTARPAVVSGRPAAAEPAMRTAMRTGRCRFLRLAVTVSLLSVAGCSAASPPPSDDGRPEVSWQDAERVVGQVASVVGRVERVGHASRVHFLDFHASRRDAFTAVVYEEHLPLFSGSLEQLYLKRTVRVSGPVTRYRGAPQIRITSPTQIEVLADGPGQPSGTPAPAMPSNSTQVRVGTFNVMNLMDDIDDPYTEDQMTPAKLREEMRRLAETIRRLDVDVLALQEVESRGFLQRFVQQFLQGAGYQSVVLVEGNDLRGIDVAVLSRFPVESVTSYRQVAFADAAGTVRHFSRDLLRATILPPQGQSFEIWCVHLKSNANEPEIAEPIRWAEVQQIRQIYDRTLAADPQARILLLGDMNDTLDSRSLRWLLGSPQHALQTLLQQLPAAQQVTYNRDRRRSMIDFILASPAMAAAYVPGSYLILHGDLSSHGSDHNPVAARFRVDMP